MFGIGSGSEPGGPLEKTFAAASLSAVGQLCSTDGCQKPAAYKTRSQPAWCTDCIDAILAGGRLAAVEPFEGPQAWRLTRCLNCGVEAHYRLVYTLDKNAVGEKTCRACYWKEWAKDARALAGEAFFPRIYSSEEIVAHADKNGYDFIATTVEVNDGDYPIIVCCRACKRISAERMGHIGCDPERGMGQEIRATENDSRR